MLDHLSIPVSDIKTSSAFYEKTLAPLGYHKIKDFGDAVSFGQHHSGGGSFDPGGDFWIYQAQAASCKAVHFAFSAPSAEDVRAFYEAGLLAGGKDNGAPGLRAHYHAGYFAAFLHDPDGYNIEAVFHEKPALM